MDIKQELIHEDEDSQLDLMIKQTRQMESSESMKKCGEIYLKEYQSFVIVCIHCNTLFSEYEDFMFHLKFDHGSVVAKPETLTEDNVGESYNIEELNYSNFVDVPNNSSIKSEYDNNEESVSNTRIQIQKNNVDPVSIKKNKNLHCEICNVKFKTKKLFIEHHESLHSIETDESVTEKNLLDISDCVEVVHKKRIRKFPCILCEKNFRTKKSLNEHNEVWHNAQHVTNLIKENNEDSIENKNESDSDYKINEDESNSCILKEKKVRIRKFLCGVCNKTFSTKKALLEHEASPHTLETMKNKSEITNDDEIDKRFECSICNKSYSKKEFLKRHEICHKNFEEHPYKCEGCKKTFASKITLDAHMRWHSGDVLPCRVCGKAFYTNKNRTRHEQIHGEKTLLCTICGKKFFKSGSLKDHVRRHQGIKPHKCEFCDMSFTSTNELAEHRRKHTGEKPFECDICNAKFAIRKSLRMHKKLHFDTADYQCKICGKSFKQFAGLYIHKKSH